MDILTDLTNMAWEMLADWPLGTIIGILIIAMCLVLIGLAAWGLFVAADSWFLPRNRRMGRVIGKTFTPAHTQMILIYNEATKTSLPHPIFHPDDWSMTVSVDDQQDSMSVSVSKEFFDSHSENDPVLTEYVNGRFSGDLYVKALFHT